MIRFLCAIIFLFNSVIYAAAQSANSYFETAYSLQAKGDHDGAIKNYSEAIRKNPQLKQAYNNRGNIWLEKSVYDKAIADYTEAIRIDPSYLSALCNRGMARAQSKDLDGAIDDINRAIRLNPKSSRPYNYLGRFWNNKPEKAIEAYTQAIRLDPNDYDSYNMRSVLYIKIGKYDDSIADTNRILKAYPKNSVLYVNRAIAFADKQEYEQSFVDFSTAIKLAPKSGEPYFHRGNAFHKKGDYIKAVADFTEAIKLNPRNDKYFLSRGMTWSTKLGNIDKGIEDLNEAIRLNSSHPNGYFNRGQLFYNKKDYEKAVADFSAAVRLAPDWQNAKEMLAFALDKNAEKPNYRNEKLPSYQNGSSPSVSTSGRRVALVIGNGNYRNIDPLENPRHDAELVAKTFREVGFDNVSIKLELTRQQFLSELKNFEMVAANAEWAVVYYAGHGMEVNGINYLIPVDAQLTDENKVSTQTVNMEYMLNSVEVAKKMRLIILDACRNDPYAEKIKAASASRSVDHLQSSAIGRGLARIEPAPGTLVVYSAKHGEFALDGDGNNSPFAEALVKRVAQKPAIELRRLFDYVREDVVDNTKKQQQPFSYGSLSARDDFYFVEK